MTITNKDGTIYRLRGPNPLMKDQSFWDSTKIILHNFDSIIDIPKEVSIPVPIILEHEIQKQEIIQEISPEPKKVIIESPVKISTNSIKVHCLPASIKIYKDILYQEEHKTISYGEKFEFNAKIVDKNDLVLIVWTPSKKITEGSIIYPQTGHARWWCVKNIEESGIGFEIVSNPSDYQPSF